MQRVGDGGKAASNCGHERSDVCKDVSSIFKVYMPIIHHISVRHMSISVDLNNIQVSNLGGKENGLEILGKMI